MKYYNTGPVKIPPDSPDFNIIIVRSRFYICLIFMRLQYFKSFEYLPTKNIFNLQQDN